MGHFISRIGVGAYQFTHSGHFPYPIFVPAPGEEYVKVLLYCLPLIVDSITTQSNLGATPSYIQDASCVFIARLSRMRGLSENLKILVNGLGNDRMLFIKLGFSGKLEKIDRIRLQIASFQMKPCVKHPLLSKLGLRKFNPSFDVSLSVNSNIWT